MNLFNRQGAVEANCETKPYRVEIWLRDSSEGEGRLYLVVRCRTEALREELKAAAERAILEIFPPDLA